MLTSRSFVELRETGDACKSETQQRVPQHGSACKELAGEFVRQVVEGGSSKIFSTCRWPDVKLQRDVANEEKDHHVEELSLRIFGAYLRIFAAYLRIFAAYLRIFAASHVLVLLIVQAVRAVNQAEMGVVVQATPGLDFGRFRRKQTLSIRIEDQGLFYHTQGKLNSFEGQPRLRVGNISIARLH